jgi:hypothetical protein
LAFGTGAAAYGVYGVMAGMWNSPLVRRAGLWLLGVHLVATLLVRIVLEGEVVRTMLTLVPVFLIVGLMVLWPRAVKASQISLPSAD